MRELRWIKCPEAWFPTEAKFTTWWLWELKKKWYWKKKWSDSSQDRKPYDCNIATKIWDYYCEVKIIKDDEFQMSMFQPNQIKALKHLTELGKNAIVCIYSKKNNSYIVHNYENIEKSFTNKK